MKRLVSYIAGTIGLAIGLIASSAFAQTTANGPYYATPSWDQTLPSNTRFIVLSNMNGEAVLDRETGLVWERTPRTANAGEFWDLASSRCASTRTGGRFGWRLPTLQELGSLIDPTATSGPPLFAGHPFIGIAPAAGYWTATITSDPVRAFIVHWGIFSGEGFFSFIVNTRRFKTDQTDAFYNVPLVGWCVRGGLQSGIQ